MSASMHDLFDGSDMNLLPDHTPEPWYPRSPASNFHHIGSNARERVAVCHTAGDALRIVACVNALSGIPTDDIQKDIDVGGYKAIIDCHQAHIEMVEKQRDNLLTALKSLLAATEPGDDYIASAIEDGRTDVVQVYIDAKSAVEAAQ